MDKLTIAINYWFCFPSLSPLFKLKLLWKSEVDLFSPDSKLETIVEAISLSTQSFLPLSLVPEWAHCPYQTNQNYHLCLLGETVRQRAAKL